MLVSYRWLCELLPELDREPSEVAEALTAVGLAVDAFHDLTAALRPVLLATVANVEPHPTRSGLQLVTVRLTSDASPLSEAQSLPPSRVAQSPAPPSATVVCGAKNVPAPGAHVVFAGLGTKLPGVDFVLEPREIGGVKSEGMLVSEAELGLAEASSGILTFEPGAFTAGERFVDAFPEARDALFEVDVTPNRPDALGHVGIARDLAAYFEVPLEVPEPGEVAEVGEAISHAISLENNAKDRCPDYGAALVRGVTLGPAPQWMRWRLHRLGIRPISNVVDITNWLLLEFGQPLHAFDLSRLRGSKIEVRLAKAGEKLTTLDGQERDLVSDDLLICDGEGPTALAGIMGGAESEIGDGTSDVVLECAYFAPRGIRRSARRHAMHTESSHRFERGCDYGAGALVLARARQLLCELAGGSAAPGFVRAGGKLPELPRVELRSQKLNRLLGVDVPFKEAIGILSRLGLSTEYLRDTGVEGGEAVIRGASHRPDISIEPDLIDEIARIRGLVAIPTRLPAIAPQTPRPAGKLERDVADISVSLGLSEALTYSFVSPQDLKKLSAPEPTVRLENPLTEERSVLRTSLAPGLLEALRRARRRGQAQVRLFALGAVFLPITAEIPVSAARPRLEEDEGVLPSELPCWAAVLAGPRHEHLAVNPPSVDVYDAKAIAIEMVERLTRRKPDVRHLPAADAPAHLHPRGAAGVFVEGVQVGTFGPLHPDVVENFELGGSCLLVEFNLAGLEAVGRVTPRYRPIPKLPAIMRDLSLVVADTTPARAVVDAIQASAGELCESVEVRAEFRGGSVPEGHRSLTFRVVYRDPQARLNPDEARTLTDKEVEQVEKLVLARTAKDFGASLRLS